MTRRIIVWDRVSADGYYAAPDGNLDWAVPEPELDRAAVGAMNGTGAMLFGRRTYEMFESFWPGVAADSPTAPDPHAEGRHSPELSAMARWINASEKLVFSRTKRKSSWKNTRFLGDFTKDKVLALKNDPGTDIMVFGSGSIVSELNRHGLVDEYQFIVSPVLLGSGRSLIRESSPVGVSLTEAKTFPSGTVLLRYAATR